jgi:hypothetical protein
LSRSTTSEMHVLLLRLDDSEMRHTQCECEKIRQPGLGWGRGGVVIVGRRVAVPGLVRLNDAPACESVAPQFAKYMLGI